jgi:L-aspartate oxidase
MSISKYDITVVGSGIAGLSTILYLSETAAFKNGALSICLLVKDTLETTNTNWAQGGIAGLGDEADSFENHIQDTMVAGGYCNNQYIVEKVIKAAPELIEDLYNWGTQFDKNKLDEFDLAKEGGHSHARIWHHADQTGHSIQKALIHQIKKLPTLSILENVCLIDAIQLDNAHFQLQLYNKAAENFTNLICSKLVLATGGMGRLYAKTTNQKVATADGIYLAHKMGASLKDLSFIQFHPTGLYQKGNISFLITEALRGSGAILRNEKGDAFMGAYDQRKELAPRDIVSRSIMQEIKKQKLPYVYLDTTSIDVSIINQHFPHIKATCLDQANLHIEKDWIPVLPVQHYACGGVQVNEFGESTVANLFCIGEVAATGLHGANRLASNSLLEAIAFAKFATPSLLENIISENRTLLPIAIPTSYPLNIKQVQEIISEFAGIIKTNEGLAMAQQQLLALKEDAIQQSLSKKSLKKNTAVNDIATKHTEFCYEHWEAMVVLEAAILLIKDAQTQIQNKGVFYNTNLI